MVGFALAMNVIFSQDFLIQMKKKNAKYKEWLNFSTCAYAYFNILF